MAIIKHPEPPPPLQFLGLQLPHASEASRTIERGL